METSPIKATDRTVVPPDAELSEDAREKLEQYIEEEEGAFNRLSGWVGIGITAAAVFVSLFHLYAAYDIVPAHVLRPAHVGMVLVLCFLLFPMARRFRDRIRWWDYLFAAASAGTIGYVLSQGAYFGDRATMPTTTDYYVGVVFIVLLLEGTRRATGWIMPGVAIAFLLYAIYGKYLPPPWTHRGYPLDDLVAHLYMTLEGIFGTTVDVASSLIILFTIFGAVLQHVGGWPLLHRFLVRGDGRPAQCGRPRRGAVVLPAWRAVGLGRGHHRHDRHGCVSAARQGRLRQECRRRAAGSGRPRRHHLAAGARCRRLPDRRVPEDLVLRRDRDGDHPDRPLLPRHPGHGGDRRPQVGRRRRADGAEGHAVEHHQAATGSTSAR